MTLPAKTDQEKALDELELQTRLIARTLGIFYSELLSQGFSVENALVLCGQYLGRLLNLNK